MKSILFYLIILFALISCEPTTVVMVDDFYENGNPERINYYSDIDQSELLRKELYYESGQLRLVGNYKNNIKHGQWLYYFENGNKSDESWYSNGLINGRSTSFYLNGKLRSSGYYQKGERTRMWTYFNEKGQLIKKIDFSVNNRDGLFKFQL